MMKISNFTMAVVVGISFYAGKKSSVNGSERYLAGFNDGVKDGFLRALIVLHINGDLSKEEVEKYMEEEIYNA